VLTDKVSVDGTGVFPLIQTWINGTKDSGFSTELTHKNRAAHATRLVLKN
jgi:hypothetical protein